MLNVSSSIVNYILAKRVDTITVIIMHFCSHCFVVFLVELKTYGIGVSIYFL